ncbi:MAG TPA: cell division ATP-binding protein FtsE [candidate division Zixibacteria bacterium]|nr:cell division ATP-binding protein FtsE [candidate division Zixibacteria bacterium]
MLEVQNITKSYSKNWTALSRVEFAMEKGEFAFLVGSSGAGKSTLLSLIIMEERPDAGKIIAAGFNSNSIAKDDIPKLRRKIGVVFQDFRLLREMTASENIAFALKVTGQPRKYIKKRVLELLAMVGLTHKSSSYPHELSGGEKQRIAVARALANNPLLLLADEPTGNLDPRATDELLELFFEINSQGTAVLMATHDTALIDQVPKRVLELENGVLVGDRAAGVMS